MHDCVSVGMADVVCLSHWVMGTEQDKEVNGIYMMKTTEYDKDTPK